MKFWTHVLWFVQKFVLRKLPQGGVSNSGSVISILKCTQWFRFRNSHRGEFWTQIQWFRFWNYHRGAFWTQIQWCFRNFDFETSPGNVLNSYTCTEISKFHKRGFWIHMWIVEVMLICSWIFKRLLHVAMHTQCTIVWLIIEQPTTPKHTNTSWWIHQWTKYFLLDNQLKSEHTHNPKSFTHSLESPQRQRMHHPECVTSIHPSGKACVYPEFFLDPRLQWFNPRTRYNEAATARQYTSDCCKQECRDFGSAPLGWLTRCSGFCVSSDRSVVFGDLNRAMIS